MYSFCLVSFIKHNSFEIHIVACNHSSFLGTFLCVCAPQVNKQIPEVTPQPQYVLEAKEDILSLNKILKRPKFQTYKQTQIQSKNYLGERISIL